MNDISFLDVLGVPGHADARAIKRAYAALLKRIDPATDPAAFGRLREAYERAIAWVSETGPQATVTTNQAVATQADAATGTAVAPGHAATPTHAPVAPVVPADPSPADDLTHTLRLADAFAAAAQKLPADALPVLLARTISRLRLGYIDAPGRFEERMIDLLSGTLVGHRVGLFAALRDAFHWDELGHLAPLGARGKWVESVMAQELEWQQVPVRARQAIMELLHQAESTALFPPSLANAWPRVASALTDFPAFLGLYIGMAKQAEWLRRFEEQHHDAVPRAPSEFRRRERSVAGPVGSISTVAVVLFALSRMMANGSVPVPNFLSSEERYVDSGTVDRERLARCTSLYVEMDRPGALDGVGEDRAERMRDEGERCLNLGYWHPPGKPTPRP
ncbi:MAG: J domain-containing protein [Luteibacter sp.]